jgi:hypothetical protein
MNVKRSNHNNTNLSAEIDGILEPPHFFTAGKKTLFLKTNCVFVYSPCLCGFKWIQNAE